MDMTHIQRVRILFKTILKLHRGLPPALQPMGNEYVRDEFKRHKQCNPGETKVFMTEWANYALTLATQLGVRGRPKGELGAPIDEEMLDKFRDEQLVQLYELMLAAKTLDEEKKNLKDK